MLLVFLVLFLLGCDARLGDIEMMLAVMARDRERLGLLMQGLIAEEFGGCAELKEMLHPSLLVWVFRREDTNLVSARLVNTNALGFEAIQFFISFAYYAALVESASHLVPSFEVRLIPLKPLREQRGIALPTARGRSAWPETRLTEGGRLLSF